MGPVPPEGISDDEDALAEVHALLERLAGDAIVISWVVVADLAHVSGGDEHRTLWRLFPEEQPSWTRNGMLAHAIEEDEWSGRPEWDDPDDGDG